MGKQPERRACSSGVIVAGSSRYTGPAVIAFFYRRPLADLIKPALDVGKFPFLRALSQQREVIERRRWRIGLGVRAPLHAI
jgi:hypothetical protein